MELKSAPTSPVKKKSTRAQSIFGRLRSTSTSDGWTTLAIALIYFLVGHLNIEFSAPDTGASAAYIPAGLSVTLVLLLGHGVWPAIAMGALLVEGFLLINAGGFPSGISILLCLLSAGASTAQAVLCSVWIHSRRESFHLGMSIASSLKTVLGIALRCLPSGLAGALFLTSLSEDSPPLNSIFLSWVSGDCFGILICLISLHWIRIQQSGVDKIKPRALVLGALALVGMGLLNLCLHATTILGISGWLLASASVAGAGYMTGRILDRSSSTAVLLILGWGGLVTLGSSHFEIIRLPDGLLTIWWFLFFAGNTLSQKKSFPLEKERGASTFPLERWSFPHSKQGQLILRQPTALLLLMCLLGILVYAFERLSLNHRMDLLSSRLTYQLEAIMDFPIQQIRLLKLTAKASDKASNQAEATFLEFPFLDAIRWVSPSGTVPWELLNPKSQESANPLPESTEQSKAHLNDLEEGKQPLMSPLHWLPSGSIGSVHWTPVHEDKNLIGFLAVDFNFKTLLEALLYPLDNRTNPFEVRISSDGDRGSENYAVTHGPSPVGTARNLKRDYPLMLFNQPLMLRMTPVSRKWYFPPWSGSNAVMAGGLLLFCMLYGFAYNRHRQSEQNKKLDREIRFRQTVQASTFEGIIVTDLMGRIVEINQAGIKLFHDLIHVKSARIFSLIDFSDCYKKHLLPKDRTRGKSLDLFPLLLKRISEKKQSIQLITKTCSSKQPHKPLSCSLNTIHDEDKSPIGAVLVVSDISDRIQYEQGIKETISRLHSVLNHSPTPTGITRHPGNQFVYVNQSWINQSGYERQDILGHTPNTLAQWDNEQVSQSIQSTLEAFGVFDNWPVQFKHASGKSMRCLLSASDYTFNEDRYTIYQWSDQTQNQELRLRLEESNRRFEQIADNIPEIFWIFEPKKGSFTYISPAFETLTGVKRSEIYENLSNLLPLIHPNEQTIVKQALKDIEDGKTTTIQYRIKNRDHGWSWIADKSFPIKGQKGHSIGSAGVATDITSQLQAEESQSLALATMDAMDALVFIFSGNPAKVSYANQRALNFLNISLTELGGSTMANCLEQICMAPSPGLIDPSPNEHTISHYRTQLRGSDSKVISVDIGLQWIQGTNEDGQWLFIATDITEQERQEKNQQRIDRLKSIGTLAGGMAHDLNNALTPLVMSVEILRRTYPDSEKIISMLESSLTRASQMVQQVLSFARGKNGSKKTVHVSELIAELTQIIEVTFPKSITIRTRCAKNLPALHVDATQIQQVLVNLCINAKDAMPDGGSISVDARSIEVTEKPKGEAKVTEFLPGNYIRFRVKDNGSGISPENQEHIFEPFFTTKPVDKGTGLGLSSSLGIIKEHDGFMDFFSDGTRGTSFDVYLPVSPASIGAQTPSKVLSPYRGDGQSVLVVDDEADIRKMMLTILRQLNLKPITARDGLEGLQVIEQDGNHAIKLCLIDMAMPKMNGLELIQAIREKFPQLPLIAMSGGMNADLVKSLDQEGVSTILTKPFSQTELQMAIENAMHSRDGLIEN